jgi:hypothetical protein
MVLFVPSMYVLVYTSHGQSLEPPDPTTTTPESTAIFEFQLLTNFLRIWPKGQNLEQNPSAFCSTHKFAAVNKYRTEKESLNLNCDFKQRWTTAQAYAYDFQGFASDHRFAEQRASKSGPAQAHFNF